jgi:hypothetical protein
MLSLPHTTVPVGRWVPVIVYSRCLQIPATDFKKANFVKTSASSSKLSRSWYWSIESNNSDSEEHFWFVRDDVTLSNGWLNVYCVVLLLYRCEWANGHVAAYDMRNTYASPSQPSFPSHQILLLISGISRVVRRERWRHQLSGWFPQCEWVVRQRIDEDKCQRLSIL